MLAACMGAKIPPEAFMLRPPVAPAAEEPEDLFEKLKLLMPGAMRIRKAVHVEGEAAARADVPKIPAVG